MRNEMSCAWEVTDRYEDQRADLLATEQHCGIEFESVEGRFGFHFSCLLL